MRQAAHDSQAQVDRSRRELSGLQLNPVPQDNVLAKCQSRFRTIPIDEIVDGECVGAGGLGRAKSIEYNPLRALQIQKAQNSLRRRLSFCFLLPGHVWHSP